MHTDELLDDQKMDRALREMMMPRQRSRAWERAQRDVLLTYIASGVARQPGVSTSRAGTFDTHVRVRWAEKRSRWPTKPLLVGAAGVAVLVGSVALNTRNAEPVEGPATTSRPALGIPPLRPDRFPLLPATDVRANAATAMYGGQIGWENRPKSDALIARIDGDTMTGAIVLTLSGDSSALPFGGAATEAVNVAGTDMELFVEEGTPVLKAVVLPGTPTLVATGLDPVAFLELAGGFPIADAEVDVNGEVSFTIGALPDGYEVVVQPTRLPLGSFDASLRVPDGDGGDGISVWVHVRNSLLGEAVTGDLHRVEINGVSGWMRDDGRASPVMWQVSETTWATVNGASTLDAALEFVRMLTFVDEATWRDHYGLEEPVYPTKEEALRPPPSTLPEPTRLIISLRSFESDTPGLTPVACGDSTYIEITVAEPLVAADEELALRTFLASADAWKLFRLGYEAKYIEQPGFYRYERYNNTGSLVTVIFVEPVDGGWAVTRWQVSPC